MSARKLVGLEQEVVEAYLQNVLVKDLAAKYGCSNVTIYNCLERNGVSRREIHLARRKSSVNDEYFSIIDTEPKAYFLGILYADGCVVAGFNQTVLTLKDREIVEAFAAAVETSIPVRKTRRGYHTVTITSKKIHQDLCRLGCTPIKTYTLRFPDPNQVPMHLVPHFARGYFDGDGCVFRRGERRYRNVHIVGNKEFLESLACHAPCQSYVKPRPKKRVHYLGISSEKEALAFRDWIYDKASVYLKRKHDIFMQSSERGLPRSPSGQKIRKQCALVEL